MARQHSFWSRLRRAIPSLRRLKPADRKVIEITANFGKYSVVIGAEYPDTECRRRALPLRTRPLEIHGTIDHLFVESDHIGPFPTRTAVDRQLRATVIINGVAVHLYDVQGNGVATASAAEPRATVEIAQTINLAGSDGDMRLQSLQHSGLLSRATYRIVQDDILKALRQMHVQHKDGLVS